MGDWIAKKEKGKKINSVESLHHSQSIPISLKALKTIDIKDPNQTRWVRILTNWVVDFVHQPVQNEKQISNTTDMKKIYI